MSVNLIMLAVLLFPFGFFFFIGSIFDELYFYGAFGYLVNCRFCPEEEGKNV